MKEVTDWREAYELVLDGRWTNQDLAEYLKNHADLPDDAKAKLQKELEFGKTLHQAVAQKHLVDEHVPELMARLQGVLGEGEEVQKSIPLVRFALPSACRAALNAVVSQRLAADDAAQTDNLRAAFELKDMPLSSEHTLSRYLTEQGLLVFSIEPSEAVKAIRFDGRKLEVDSGSYYMELGTASGKVSDLPCAPIDVDFVDGSSITLTFE